MIKYKYLLDAFLIYKIVHSCIYIYRKTRAESLFKNDANSFLHCWSVLPQSDIEHCHNYLVSNFTTLGFYWVS